MLTIYYRTAFYYHRIPQLSQWLTLNSTALFYLKTIADNMILKEIKKNDSACITYAFAPLKYDEYEEGALLMFSDMFIGYFFVLSVILPLLTLIGKFMTDKSTRMRDSMKLMGINDSTYFLSYFLFYLLLQFIVSFGCTAIIKTTVFPKSNYFIIAGLLLLFGISVYPFAIIIW